VKSVTSNENGEGRQIRRGRIRVVLEVRRRRCDIEMDFLEAIRDDWDAVAQKGHMKTEQWDVDAKEAAIDGSAEHWHWAGVWQRTLLELCNTETRRAILREVDVEYEAAFGSQEWMYAVAEVVGRALPIASTNFKLPFWFTLGHVPSDVYEKHSEENIPVFSDQVNARLRSQRGSREKWTKFFGNYYQNYLSRVSDIYAVVDPSDPEKPRYRLGRSLAISPDQRIFLVSDGETQKVAKWSATIGEALRSWTKVQKAGTKMPKFEVGYFVSPTQRVLLMEPLMPIAVSDNIYAILLDVLPQLETIHRAGMVHSDLKLDNIMKRDGKRRKYFIIDYDSISYHPIEGIDNAVARRVYSMLWASQIWARGTVPTSYRYDLEELFYAVGDLAKQQRRADLGDSAKVDVYSDAKTLMKAKYAQKDIISLTHQTQIVGDRYLSQLHPRIMNLPERLPFEQIDHSALIAYIRDGMATSQLKCEIGIAGSAATSAELEYQHQVDCRIHAVRLCAKCDKIACSSCKNCKTSYCSPLCQAADWRGHKKVCSTFSK
jgi:hypothetical protein